MDAPPAGNTKCSPTWAQPSPDGARVCVACNATTTSSRSTSRRGRCVRRIPAGDGVYNLAVTRDGRLLVATNKRGQSVSVIDVASGQGAGARSRRSGRSCTASRSRDDDRYAFISVEGIGAEPGTVEMIDLRRSATRRVASTWGRWRAGSTSGRASLGKPPGPAFGGLGGIQLSVFGDEGVLVAPGAKLAQQGGDHRADFLNAGA